MISRKQFYYRNDGVYLFSDKSKNSEFIKWINEKLDKEIRLCRGFGYEAIQAKVNLGVLREMSTFSILMRSRKQFKIEKGN